jgi:cytochrome c-type biogenesis protein CcmH/NrfG
MWSGIKLLITWFLQGYFRKAEVEFSTFHFSDALISYSLALKLQPNDPSILEAIAKTALERQKDRKGNI